MIMMIAYKEFKLCKIINDQCHWKCHTVQSNRLSFLRHHSNPLVIQWTVILLNLPAINHSCCFPALKKVRICLADQCVSVLPFCSHSQGLGCCSTLMACLSEGGCQSLRQQKHLRSWSTLRDSLWCQSFLSQMQGIASDKQKRTSSLTYWECLWVLNSCASFNGVKGVSPALWCMHAVHSKLFQFPLI